MYKVRKGNENKHVNCIVELSGVKGEILELLKPFKAYIKRWDNNDPIMSLMTIQI